MFAEILQISFRLIRLLFPKEKQEKKHCGIRKNMQSPIVGVFDVIKKCRDNLAIPNKAQQYTYRLSQEEKLLQVPSHNIHKLKK